MCWPDLDQHVAVRVRPHAATPLDFDELCGPASASAKAVAKVSSPMQSFMQMSRQIVMMPSRCVPSDAAQARCLPGPTCVRPQRSHPDRYRCPAPGKRPGRRKSNINWAHAYWHWRTLTETEPDEENRVCADAPAAPNLSMAPRMRAGGQRAMDTAAHSPLILVSARPQADLRQEWYSPPRATLHRARPIRRAH